MLRLCGIAFGVFIHLPLNEVTAAQGSKRLVHEQGKGIFQHDAVAPDGGGGEDIGFHSDILFRRVMKGDFSVVPFVCTAPLKFRGLKLRLIFIRIRKRDIARHLFGIAVFIKNNVRMAVNQHAPVAGGQFFAFAIAFTFRISFFFLYLSGT